MALARGESLKPSPDAAETPSGCPRACGRGKQSASNTFGETNVEGVAEAETMVFSGFFIAIIIGGIAGWLAGKLVAGGGFGLFGNVILGIGGAILAEWLFPLLGVNLGSGFFGSVISAMIGATIVLIAIRIFKKI